MLGSVTECHSGPLPDAYPHCRGSLVGTDAAKQFHTQLPRRLLSTSSLSIWAGLPAVVCKAQVC